MEIKITQHYSTFTPSKTEEVKEDGQNIKG
jgi:hypothetical protein